MKNIPIVYTIINLSEVTLPKEVDLTNDEANIYLKYNLPTEEKTDCLKVTYLAGDTSGFCYTSPTGITDAKGWGWMALAFGVDVGLQITVDFLSGGTLSGIGSLGSCLLGNYIMWYGESAVSKEKQESYWPHNIYFDNYYTK